MRALLPSRLSCTTRLQSPCACSVPIYSSKVNAAATSAALPSALLHPRYAASSFSDSSIPAHEPCRALSTASASSSDAPSASALSSAATPLRFRTGRRRMTALERAAAIAHEALANATAAAAPASATAASGGSNREPVRAPKRIGVILAAASRSGGRTPPAAAAFADEDLDAARAEAEAQAEREAEERRRRFVGQLQGVPHVVAAAEQLQSARKRASKVTPSAGIKNEAEKERNRAARRLDVLMKELSVPLSRYVTAFPAPERLHSFEAALLALTVGEGAYRAALQRVDRLRKVVQEVGKGAASRAANAPNKAAATALSEEGAAAIEEVFQAGARHVDSLKEIAKKLRSLPSLDTSLPTLALVGAPNVGKSSLVNILSSGTPEVCNYPFTTRSIKMGHFYLDSQKHQVTDTPGLLRRPDSERNRMEALTLAALGCLDTAVLFVADLTEECGTSVADQWAIRSELRYRFPDRPWLDVLSKADMLEDTFAAADELVLQCKATAAAVAASSATNSRISAAGAGVAGEWFGATHGDTNGDRPESDGGRVHWDSAGVDDAVSSAVDMAARLPQALRISSLTHDGIPQLQLGIIRMLRARALWLRQQEQEQQQRQQPPHSLAPSALPQRPAAAHGEQPVGDPGTQQQQATPGGTGAPAGKPPVLTFFAT